MEGKDAQHCSKCEYSSKTYSHAQAEVICDYIGVKGVPRGCKPGRECIRFEKKVTRRRIKTP